MIVRQLAEMSLLVLLVFLTVFFTTLMRIIDFSQVYNDEIQLSQAARLSARIAAVGTLSGISSSEAIARFCAALNNPAFHGNAPGVGADVVNSVGPAVTSSAVCTDSANLARVTKTISYNKSMWGPSTLTQTAVM